MTTSGVYRTGLVALAIAGVSDFFQLRVIGTPDSAPLPVMIFLVVLGLVTVAGVVGAWRGSRAGIVLAIVARIIDVVLGLPAFLLDAPAWVLTIVTLNVALTVFGVGVLVWGARQQRSEPVQP